MDESGFEEVDHTADWALRARGRDLADLCRQAAKGMIRLTGAEVGSEPTLTWEPDIWAADAESLLVRWLEEVLFRMESQQLAVREMDLSTEAGPRLRGKVALGPLLRLGKAIKAVTYHGLKVHCDRRGCEATIVFDV
ncbi:MAG TPA: archease [Anaerolineales bacterium]|nr:archease [Anaerolineales bacterium]